MGAFFCSGRVQLSRRTKFFMRNMLSFISCITVTMSALCAPAHAADASEKGLVTIPFDTPNFGLDIVPGTALITEKRCQTNTQENPDERKLCIDIPDNPSYQTWWQDQYSDQLIAMGWKSMGNMPRAPYNMQMLNGTLAKSCASQMIILTIDDRDMPEPETDTAERHTRSYGKLLVFINKIPTHCHIPGRKLSSEQDLSEPVVNMTVPNKINLGGNLKIKFKPASRAVEKDRRAKEDTPDKLWIGFFLENTKTQKREYLGDAVKIWSGEFSRVLPIGLPTGTYKAYAYEYGTTVKRRDAGWSRPFEIVPLTEGAIWVLAGTEAQVCRTLAQTQSYQILGVKPRKCGPNICSDGPRNYFLPSGQSVSVMQNFGGTGLENLVSIQCGT